ncbi:hypothetical protein EK21DRAFT_68731 [Setomelanomma holmii]|uniref:Uncharacterized protein n=1 Tax=Setomelanomma holmii TaxID=210430 RepID=A0A9P4H651_9PLEO|nr:hypothetical protein EK21DRAFT_68731 [Setomelanomma holmii]
MIRDYQQDAHNERQILACARVIHNIDIADMQILRLPVFTCNEDDNMVLEEQWIAVLAHPGGMRKVLEKTEPHQQEWQAVSVLLGMMQHDARKKLFGGVVSS